MYIQENLTKQERKILELVANGLRNSKIANELFISTKTVETHLHHIFSKLGVSSRTEAALYFWRAAARPHSKIDETFEDSAIVEG
jgi:DNA-binding NarL/FixJ family response regulator